MKQLEQGVNAAIVLEARDLTALEYITEHLGGASAGGTIDGTVQ